MGDGDELGLSGLAVVADLLFEEDGGGGGAGDGAVDGQGFREDAVEDGGVGFGDAAVLDGALELRAEGGVAGEEDDTGGFAVEAGGHVEGLFVEDFAGGSDEGGPGSVFGGMADDEAGLIDGGEFRGEEEEPGLEFGGGDEPPPVGLGHETSLVVAGGEPGIDESGEGGAEEGRDPEEPELFDGPAPDEDGGAEGAGGIDGGIGNGDGDEVDEGEARPMGMGAKPSGARRSVAPRMTRRKKKVRTTSAVRQAARE
jgi:hypothetical protein